MSKELAKIENETTIATIKKPDSQVAKQFEAHEISLGREVAMKALNLVKPMISSVAKELSDMLGDNERIIIIRKTKQDSQVSIMILDTNEDFTIKGKKANDGKFLFTGAGNRETKKLYAIKNFYIAEEFVDMLLTGRMEDMTKKLM